jgi:hypothetical protein
MRTSAVAVAAVSPLGRGGSVVVGAGSVVAVVALDVDVAAVDCATSSDCSVAGVLVDSPPEHDTEATSAAATRNTTAVLARSPTETTVVHLPDGPDRGRSEHQPAPRRQTLWLRRAGSIGWRRQLPRTWCAGVGLSMGSSSEQSPGQVDLGWVTGSNADVRHCRPIACEVLITPA